MGDKICQFYVRGACKRSRCEFRHPHETRVMLDNREADRRKQRERDDLEEKRNGRARHYSLSPDTAKRPRERSKQRDYSPKRRRREPESRARECSPRCRSRSQSRDRRRRVDYSRLPVAETPCKFYLGSGCKFGLTCAFKHVKRHHLRTYRSRSRSPWRPLYPSPPRRSSDRSPYHQHHKRLSSRHRSPSYYSASPSPVRHERDEGPPPTKADKKSADRPMEDVRRSRSPRRSKKATNEEVVVVLEDAGGGGGSEEKPGGKVCSSVSPISIGKSPSPAGGRRQEKGLASPIYWRSISPPRRRRKSEEKKAPRSVEESHTKEDKDKSKQSTVAAQSSPGRKERRRSWSEDSAGVPKPGSRCRKCGQAVPE